MKGALDDLIGRNISLDEAYDNVFDGANAVTKSFAENGATLDVLTESGRANRGAVRDQVAALVDLGVELVNTGSTNEEASAQVLGLRDSLIEQQVQAGLTREEAEAYIDQLGLTPENIETAIRLAGEELAKEKIKGHISELGKIPDAEATAIEALINEGNYSAAEQRLNQLARTRDAIINIKSASVDTRSAATSARGSATPRAATTTSRSSPPSSRTATPKSCCRSPNLNVSTLSSRTRVSPIRSCPPSVEPRPVNGRSATTQAAVAPLCWSGRTDGSRSSTCTTTVSLSRPPRSPTPGR